MIAVPSVLRKKPKRYIIAIVLIVITGIFYFCSEGILSSIGSFLITEDRLKEADVIIVLTGSAPDRVMEAIDIYKDGFAKKIVFAKEVMPKSYKILLHKGIKIQERHDINKLVLSGLGVPDNDIKCLQKRIGSTYEEASVVADYVREKGYDSLILVTSKTHSKRAYLTFRLYLGEDIEIINKPTGYDGFDPDAWWTKREDAKSLVSEYIKMLIYSVYYKI